MGGKGGSWWYMGLSHGSWNFCLIRKGSVTFIETNRMESRFCELLNVGYDGVGISGAACWYNTSLLLIAG